jgi:hypothetical protein
MPTPVAAVAQAVLRTTSRKANGGSSCPSFSRTTESSHENIGDFIFSIFGDEGVERPGRDLCGEREDRQSADVLPGGEIEYVRCFAVSEADLGGGSAVASFSGFLAGIGGPYWFEVDASSVNFE